MKEVQMLWSSDKREKGKKKKKKKSKQKRGKKEKEQRQIRASVPQLYPSLTLTHLFQASGE